MITIRAAVGDDLPAIERLFNALIPSTTIAWRDHLASAAEIEGWFAQQRAESHPVLVAEVDGAVIGYASWTRFRGGPRFPGYRYTVEHSIHVDGNAHRRGIGGTLLLSLMDLARGNDVHVMVAGIDADNEVSIRFHAAMGFSEVARMPEVGRKGNRWLELVLMQRIIR